MHKCTFSLKLKLDLTIKEIFQNNMDLVVFETGNSFVTYVHPSSTSLFLDLLKDANQDQCASSSTVRMTFDVPEIQLHIIHTDDGYILLGSCEIQGTSNLIKELVKINNQQLNQMRDLYKEKQQSMFETSFYDEFSLINNQLMNTQRELNQKNIELAILNEKFKRMGLFDFLTDLPNRRSFFDDIYTLLQEEQYDLIMMDLNNFKLINDTMGHDKGDEVLIVFANQLQKFSPKETKIYRLGGDEFAILNPYRSIINIEQIIQATENQLKKIHPKLGISFGKVLVDENDILNDKSIEDAMHKADQLMYIHKQKTKNSQ